MNRDAVTIAAVGAGHRTNAYCEYALRRPEEARVVAIAEPDAERRCAFARKHGIAADMQFESYQDLVAKPRLADAAINGTMDRLHYESSMALIGRGYNLLLEKPIAVHEQHVRDLIAGAKRQNVLVMICHVLRYAPFYQLVRRLLDENRIGQILTMRTGEYVSYHHMATAFVRGRWNRRDTSNPILMSKCCHDLDLIAWLMSPTPATRVASFGSLQYFKAEQAPAGAARRCLDQCDIESTCPYSARRLYVDHSYCGEYPFEMIANAHSLSREQKLASLKQDNPYGRCVWHCDNDVFDHHSVLVEFANGATATHDLFCATARPTRTIHVVGTRGEIEGDFASGVVTLRTIDPSANTTTYGYQQETFDSTLPSVVPDAHGGGDSRLVADFIRTVRGQPVSSGTTRIEDSLMGHLIGFAADVAVQESRVVSLQG